MKRRSRKRTRMPRKDKMRYLGFGTLFAAYMTAIWRIGEPRGRTVIRKTGRKKHRKGI